MALTDLTIRRAQAGYKLRKFSEGKQKLLAPGSYP